MEHIFGNDSSGNGFLKWGELLKGLSQTSNTSLNQPDCLLFLSLNMVTELERNFF